MRPAILLSQHIRKRNKIYNSRIEAFSMFGQESEDTRNIFCTFAVRLCGKLKLRGEL